MCPTGGNRQIGHVLWPVEASWSRRAAAWAEWCTHTHVSHEIRGSAGNRIIASCWKAQKIVCVVSVALKRKRVYGRITVRVNSKRRTQRPLVMFTLIRRELQPLGQDLTGEENAKQQIWNGWLANSNTDAVVNC